MGGGGALGAPRRPLPSVGCAVARPVLCDGARNRAWPPGFLVGLFGAFWWSFYESTGQDLGARHGRHGKQPPWQATGNTAPRRRHGRGAHCAGQAPGATGSGEGGCRGGQGMGGCDSFFGGRDARRERGKERHWFGRHNSRLGRLLSTNCPWRGAERAAIVSLGLSWMRCRVIGLIALKP